MPRRPAYFTSTRKACPQAAQVTGTCMADLLMKILTRREWQASQLEKYIRPGLLASTSNSWTEAAMSQPLPAEDHILLTRSGLDAADAVSAGKDGICVGNTWKTTGSEFVDDDLAATTLQSPETGDRSQFSPLFEKRMVFTIVKVPLIPAGLDCRYKFLHTPPQRNLHPLLEHNADWSCGGAEHTGRSDHPSSSSSGMRGASFSGSFPQ